MTDYAPLQYIGFGILALGVLAFIASFGVAFLGATLGPNVLAIASPIFMVLGWGAIALAFLILFLYVLLDRLQEMKKDDLGDHTNY